MPQYPNRDGSPRDDSLARSVRLTANQAVLSNVRTMIPGMVEEYNPDTKRATVQIIVRQTFRDGSSRPRPPLVDVPVIQPSTGGYMIHMPIKPGEIVMVSFTQTGLETFKNSWGSGKLVEPVPASAFSDAVAFPWGSNDYQPVTNDGIVLQTKDGKTFISVKEDEIMLKSGSKFMRITPQRGDISG